MTKIVYNACHGGFGLSDAATIRYAELNGTPVYPEKTYWTTIFWTIPPEERSAIGILSDEAMKTATLDEQNHSNDVSNDKVLYFDDVKRDDPILVQVVEELGEAANGEYSSLLIKELPAGTRYRIDEYDGNEEVMTIDDYNWRTA